MGIYSMGAMSSANKETRILRLKAYLNQANPNGNGVNRYNSLTPQGLQNLAIAKREAEFLEKANRKSKKR